MKKPVMALWLGVALPIAMLVLDPLVFHNPVSVTGSVLLGEWRPFCYAAIAIAILVLLSWLWRRGAASFSAGVLGAAALFASGLGLVLLPYSVMGLRILGLGLLGFSPFVVAWVYARTARGAVAAARAAGTFSWTRVVTGAALFFTVPSVVHVAVVRATDAAMRDIRSGVPARIDAAVTRLRWCTVLVDRDRLVEAWLIERDPAVKGSLAEAYHRLTGSDVASRAPTS